MPRGVEEGEVISSDEYSDTGKDREHHRRRKSSSRRRESSRHRSSSHRHHHHRHRHYDDDSSSDSDNDRGSHRRDSHSHRDGSKKRERSNSRSHSRGPEELSKKQDKYNKSSLSIESKVPELEEGEVAEEKLLLPPETKKIEIDLNNNINNIKGNNNIDNDFNDNNIIKDNNINDNFNNNNNINNTNNDNIFNDDDDIFEKKGPSEEELAAQRRERIRQIKEMYKKLEEEKQQKQEKEEQEGDRGQVSGETQITVQDSHTSVSIPNVSIANNSSTLINLETPGTHADKPKEGRLQNTVNKKPAIDLFAIDSDEEDDEVSQIGKVPNPTISPNLSIRETSDTFNDSEGYYRFRLGDIIGGKYEVIEPLGKGVYSTVMLCRLITSSSKKDSDADKVAIKLSRANDVMRKAGQREADIVRRLQASDPEGKMHIIKLIETFEFRGHYCSVFEHMCMNLRDVLTNFGKNVGINLSAVRTYAQQIFIGLQHIHSCGLIHADIKLDNIVVGQSKACAKICDFGTAFDYHETEAAPYLASRFYRAPEAILGVPYDGSVDVWAAGCCLAELYTGKVLFPGVSNNDMLRLFCELRGPFSKKFLRKGAFTNEHFDENLTFVHASGQVPKPIVFTTPKDFDTVLGGGFTSTDPAEFRKYGQFKDLLDKCLTLDPKKRWTAAQLLKHPFISN